MSDASEKCAIEGRLMSLDALRGLDMFFLVGFAGIFKALAKVSPDNAFFQWLASQCRHPKWDGFTAWDLIFPMFIFILGVVMPFSFAKRLTQPGGQRRLFVHVLVRALILTGLGMVLWLQPGGMDPQYGYYSVLYRIAFSYFFAAVIVMNTGVRGQACWAFGLLIAYWLAVRLIPVPGHGGPGISYEVNWQTYIHEQVALHLSPAFSYVLSVSLITSVSNALLGALAGHWLRSQKTPDTKALGLLLAGLGSIGAALLVHLDFPINKEFGSTSFVLLTCGISAAMLAMFYWVIDVKGYRAWAFVFVVVGMNSITIYVANRLIKFDQVAQVLAGVLDFGAAQVLAVAITAAALKWLFLYVLYSKRVFLKI